MKKLSLVVGALLIVGVLVTSAFSFPLSVRNGSVLGYTAGKSLTIRGFDRNIVNYNVTTNTKVMPSDMSSDLKAGARVTVFADCFHSLKSSGCTALSIWVRQAVSSGAQSTTPAATAQPAPQATPTP